MQKKDLRAQSVAINGGNSMKKKENGALKTKEVKVSKGAKQVVMVFDNKGKKKSK